MAAVVVAFLLSCGLLAPSVAAQTDADAADPAPYAFLVSQPRRDRSLPVLPPNGMQFVHARYDLGGEPVDVYVVDLDVGGSGRLSWAPAVCTRLVLERYARSQEAVPVYRVDRDGYRVYMASAAPSPDLCVFASAFTTTFEFFLQALGASLNDEVPPEFPAVLEMRR